MPLTNRYRVVHLCTDDRVDRRILDGARLLTEAGWPTLVIAAAPPGDLADETSYPDVPIFRLMGSWVPADRLPEEPSDPQLAAVQAAGRTFNQHQRLLAAALAFPCEVIIANDLPQLPAGILAARAHGAALIYDAHEFYPSQPFTKGASAALEELERSLIGHADVIVTVNDSIADLMAMKYKCQRPVTVLNCPSTRHRGAVSREESPLRAFVGATPQQRVLLYQGNLAGSRNLEELVDGMARVTNPDVVLAFMGKGSAVGDALKARAQALGLLGSRVHFIPEKSAAELLAWTVGADAGIIPYPHSDMNTWLVSPNKLYEFLAVGLPILASHGPELRRFVGDLGVGINAHLATPQDFAEAIDAFFANSIDGFRERAAAVSSRFTWEHEGRQWLGLVERAVHARSTRTLRRVA
ncbi:MAG: glycosyltransferase [Gemmatimonadaceae bacterium]|nr:glycosyltransferase [Gemmatimonadaceae bacterium]